MLTVNVKKKKVVVYTRPRSKVPPPHLTYMSDPIEALDSFRYLGVDLHSTQQFCAQPPPTACSPASQSAFALHNRCHDLRLHDPALMLHLFDALVRPVMLYGVEILGAGALCGAGMEACEVVHRQFLRRLLGVRAGTPCVAVLGEVGRFPVAHAAVLLLCRYWNRLVAMPTPGDRRRSWRASAWPAAAAAAARRRPLSTLGQPGGVLSALHVPHR